MLKSVYALVGTDSFLFSQHLRAIMEEAPPDAQRLDVDGQSAELPDVLDELRSFAMFGGRKVLVLRNANDFISKFRQQMEAFLTKAPEQNTLVLRLGALNKREKIVGIIHKIAQVIDCNPPAHMQKWLTARATEAHQLTLESDAARWMLQLIGEDLGRLDNELAKLALESPGSKITARQVQRTVAFQKEQEVVEMTNALALGDVPLAVRRWRQMLQSDSSAEFRAITWLFMWLEDVIQFLALPGKFANVWRYRTLGLAHFQKTAGRIGLPAAAQLLRQLTELDYRCKTGVGSPAQSVERFLLSIPLQ